MTDLDIIKQIEKELNIKLEKLDGMKFGSEGYTLNQNGQVTGLGFWECNIKNLNRIISSLKALTNLTNLQLIRSQLRDISPLNVVHLLKGLILLDGGDYAGAGYAELFKGTEMVDALLVSVPRLTVVYLALHHHFYDGDGDIVCS